MITTHELLPKFKNVLAQTPTVKHIIFLEDQVNPTDKTGYRQDVNIHAFQEVIEMGRTTTVNYPVRRPTLNDPGTVNVFSVDPLKLTSPKGFSASKCDVGNWMFSKF